MLYRTLFAFNSKLIFYLNVPRVLAVSLGRIWAIRKARSR